MKKLFFNNIFKNTMYEFDKDNVEKVVIRIISDLGIPNNKDTSRLSLTEKYLQDYLYRYIYPTIKSLNSISSVHIEPYRDGSVYEITILE